MYHWCIFGSQFENPLELFIQNLTSKKKDPVFPGLWVKNMQLGQGL
ncbi:hypothetical protein ASZ90_017705 [hydrocarbon metagenome]|uniref:Uncharacterized protein n=1 Tax=hydrocarbon metagenome TaxID=938273 RepID=A0A0W8E8C9_9ZZZZ